MTRSGYMEGDGYPEENWWAHIRYRGAVTSAYRGRRGQAFLREALAALDEVADGKLAARDFERDGCFCTLGAVAKARGMDLKGVDPSDARSVAAKFGIAEAMAREIVYENDEGNCSWHETPERRFRRMRRYLSDSIRKGPDR